LDSKKFIDIGFKIFLLPVSTKKSISWSGCELQEWVNLRSFGEEFMSIYLLETTS